MKKKRIDDYLLNEMSADEREKFENRFFEDDEFFFEVAERENALVDRYVNRDMSPDKRKAFARSLESLPARREKVANARVIQDLIIDSADEDPSTITIAERQSFLSRLGELFKFGSPAFQFASIVVVAVLAIGSVVLLRENRRLGSLEQQLAESQQRENELATQIGDERDAASDLTAELNAERERREALEVEIAKLRNTPPVTNTAPPTIATLVLPIAGIKGVPAPVKRLELPTGTTKVSILITSLAGVQPGERMSVTLNGVALPDSPRVRDKAGDFQIHVNVSSTQLADGENTITVHGANNEPVKISFVVSRRTRE